MTNYPERGLHGRAVGLLAQRILRGDYEPGHVIDLEALGSELGASRTVVREALKVLSSKGMVDARQNRGTFVLASSSWRMLDPDVLTWRFEHLGDPALFENLAEIRQMIEPAAARLAAERRTAADIETLRSAFAAMSTAAAARDNAAFVAADVDFHRSLLKATGNELIASLASVIESGLRSRDEIVHSHRASTKAGLDAHRSVVDAVIAGNSDDAESSMRRLVTAAGRDQRSVLRRRTPRD